VQNLIWIGAHAYLRNQERGMPRHGTVTGVKGATVEVRRILSDAQKENDLIEDFGVYDINDVQVSPPSSVPVAWDEDWEPILVQEPGVIPESVLLIERFQAFDTIKPFLSVVNADVMILPDNTERITVPHSFARDDEGSASKVFHASLSMTKFHASWGNRISWLSLMGAPQFFDPSADNPWKHAVEQNDAGREHYDANYGYPYMPPVADIAKHTFPMPVKMTLWYGSPSRLVQMLHPQED
jgi:hypothetical protein